MDLDAFIAEDTKIVEPPKGQLPLGYSPPPPPLPRDQEKIKRMNECLDLGFGDMIEAFDSMPEGQGWTKREVRQKAVKKFMVGDQVKQIELRLYEQCRWVIDGKTEQERAAALQKVEEAMKYYVDLVLYKIAGGK